MLPSGTHSGELAPTLLVRPQNSGPGKMGLTPWLWLKGEVRTRYMILCSKFVEHVDETTGILPIKLMQDEKYFSDKLDDSNFELISLSGLNFELLISILLFDA